jgi:hypothetical protein
MPGFRCITCGQFHPALPLVLGARAPAPWDAIPPADRSARTQLTSDQCIIDNVHFFLLGRLELPVLDGQNPFTWLTWVSVGAHNFERASALWHSQGRESEEPYFAWVQSALPYPRSTLELKADLITKPIGQRPLVILHETDHPLYREQCYGITMVRVQEIVEAALHEA